MDSIFWSIGLICSGIILSQLFADSFIPSIINWVQNLINSDEDVEINVETNSIWNKLLSIFKFASHILPSMFLSVYMYLLYNALEENNETDLAGNEEKEDSTPEESDNGLSPNERAFNKCLIHPFKIKSSFATIGGLQNEIKVIKRSLLPITEHKITAMLNSPLMQAPGGILLYGPPGCGKTLLAKALAKEVGIKFMNVKSSDIKCSLYGKTEAKISAMFSFAEKIQPVILFIDEIDSLLRSRSNEGSNELSVTRGIKNLFMQHMDGLLNNEKKQIVVIGATNRKEDIDPAILRRMHPQIFIGHPNIDERKEIFQNILLNESLDLEIDFAKLANETNGFSGSEIRDICKTAALNILEEVVDNFKTKSVKSKNCLEKEAQDICSDIINNVLLQIVHNKKDKYLYSKKSSPREYLKKKRPKISDIHRPFTTDDILKVVSQWRNKNLDDKDQFPMYI